MTISQTHLENSRVGALLEHAKTKYKINNGKLAITLGYKNGDRTVSQILTGKKELPFDKIAIVSYRLNIPIEELLIAVSEDYQKRLVQAVGEKWPYLRKSLFLS